MRTIAIGAVRFDPGAVKTTPVSGSTIGRVFSRGVAYAQARENVVPLSATVKGSVIHVGNTPMLSSAVVRADCQFKSFHKAKFAWR